MTLGGPLLRYSEMPQSAAVELALWKSPAWWTELGLGSAKFATGVLLGMVPPMGASEGSGVRLSHVVTLVLIRGPVGFYLTFAGYFDLMQMLARVMGPSCPTASTGRSDVRISPQFWANWNMTATRVFRDYLFYSRWGLRRYNVYVNTLVLFTLVGLWHGANAYWIPWGFLHGVMFCAFLAWRKWGASRGRAITGTPADVASRVATYLGVCAAWYLPSKVLQWLGVI